MNAPDRRQQALVAIAVGAVLLIAGLAATFWPGRQAGLAEPPDSLAPLLAVNALDAHQIRIVSADDEIELRRTLEGWNLVSRGGYPADSELADRLLNGLSALTPVAQRTGQESRLNRLELDAPETGGGGVRVAISDANDRQLADIMLGRQRPDGQIYIRQSDRSQSWLARGFVPEIRSSANWMTLDFISLGRDAIRETCVQPESGDPYCLQRLRLSSDQFSLVSPRGWGLVSAGAGDGVATVLGRLRFQDVQPSAGFGGRLISVYRTTTINGLEVTLTLHRTSNGDWATVRAVAQTDAARTRAIEINERTDGWAFQVSDLASDRLTRPLSSIASPETEPASP